MGKQSIIKDDYVMIITGKDKGKTAQVIAIKKDRVYIEGDNVTEVTKAVKAQRAQDAGGLVKRPSSVNISNVMPICSACENPTRVGSDVIDGKKVRICKKCGAVLVTKKPTAKIVRKAKAAVRRKPAKKAEASEE